MSLRGLLPVLSGCPEYQQLLQRVSSWPQEAQQWLLSSLSPAARPYLIASLQKDLQAPLLVIVPRAEDAKRLQEQVLLWSAQPGDVLVYPEPDVLPLERAPGGDLSARQRMAVLARLAGLDATATTGKAPVVIASLRAVLHRTLPVRDLSTNSRVLRRGQRLALGGLLSHLLHLGYDPVSLVEQPGQVSRRGGIVDVFPLTSDDPVRLEFFGDEIDSMRRFDPATQRSTGATESLTITPPTEVLPENGTQAAERLASVDVSTLSADAAQQWQADIERLRAGASGQQARELWQFYAPYFHAGGRPATLLDHFDGLLIVVEAQELALAAESLAGEANDLKSGKIERGELPESFPAAYVEWSLLEAAISRRPRLALEAQEAPDNADVLPALPFALAPVYGGRLKQVLDDCQRMAQQGQRVIITSHQAKRLSALLQERDVIAAPLETLDEPPPAASLTIVHGSLAEGWLLNQSVTVLSDVEIFGWAKPRRGVAQRRQAANILLSDLAAGDYVVHIEHGVAIFRGLVKMAQDGAEREYLQLDYAEGDKLYVPTDQIDRVNRYVGAGESTPTLTTLGSGEWEHAKRRASKAVQDVARELLGIYAARQVVSGTPFSPDTVWQGELEASFPYVETADQLRAINEVKEDMEKPQPMDRLICGDVGYGKTEVALRAAFKAVADGKQVAILVPTTILAQQHYNTFRERLAAFPVRVDMLSRFRTEREQKQVVKQLREGQIDILIGTHRLIQKDVVFKNLALVIIDEEQRFGVMHKERLKKLRQEVDVLTLTATPIPRTLHMSLVGVRDMSTIDTPPEDRLPITTVVSVYDENLIRQAIMRELDRGGQVYFVHNRVQSIGHITYRLQNLLRNVTFAVGHGQMPEDDLARVMLDFASGKMDVLVCTAIIESGVDIPNVNTIIINRADQFGLAQLYQLRGRVGRGANRAYAYLLHDRSFQLSETAEQRLRAIFEASSLGAGYRIAMKDLEIRGAGNLLGVEQSGQIAAVGFDLYTRLLAAEVERLKEEGLDGREGNGHGRNGDVELASPHPSVSLPVDAFLPISYVADDSTRLALYQRMAALSTVEEVADMRHEMVDRFGKLPPSVDNLLYVLEIKALAEGAGVATIATHEHELVLKMKDGVGLDQPKLSKQFGPLIKVGSVSLRIDRRKTSGRWREQLRAVVAALQE